MEVERKPSSDCHRETTAIRTGIYGGSFNPIHVGHVALARYVIEQHLVDEVWLLVSPQNPLKPQSGLLDETLRLRLAEKALKGETSIHASDFEFHLPRPSYTWHTLEKLSEAYPERRFSLIIGGDNWQCFDKWFRHDDILNSYPVIVYPRHDSTCCEREGVLFVHAPLLNVSSTEIRERIRQGLSISGLVPNGIEKEVERAFLSVKY